MENKANSFLTFKEACNYLKVGANQLGDICRSGKITYYKGKGQTAPYRFKERDLNAYMDRHEKKEANEEND